MIVLPEKKVVIITPPKTGSTSLHQHFCVDTKEGIYVIGPQGDSYLPDGSASDIDKHTNKIPFDFRDFKKYIIVRNPAERFVSLYHHYCHWVKNIPLWSYKEEHLYDASWFYRWTLDKFHVPGAIPIRLETINTELLSLGLIQKELPHLHKRNRESYAIKDDCPNPWWFNDNFHSLYNSDD